MLSSEWSLIFPGSRWLLFFLDGLRMVAVLLTTSRSLWPNRTIRRAHQKCAIPCIRASHARRARTSQQECPWHKYGAPNYLIQRLLELLLQVVHGVFKNRPQKVDGVLYELAPGVGVQLEITDLNAGHRQDLDLKQGAMLQAMTPDDAMSNVMGQAFAHYLTPPPINIIRGKLF